MSTNEHTKWREFLQPVITGLCALMAAGAFALQQSDSYKYDSRITAIEVRMEASGKRTDKFEVLLGDIRSDVSFIRGKLEGGKGR